MCDGLGMLRDVTSVPTEAVADTDVRRGRYHWVAQVLVNVVVGLLAAAGWPFVYFMGYAVAMRAGWIVGDPTVTDDGVSLTIGFGVVAMLIIVGLFVGLNLGVSQWTRVSPMRWLPAGLIVIMVVATVAVRVFWYL